MQYQMNIRKISRYQIGVLFALMVALIVSSSASYVYQGEILLLRSQYLETNTFNMDGQLNEDFWSKAGFKTFNTSNRLLDVRYINNEADFLFSLSFKDQLTSNSSLGLYFDVDADGVLSTPEDAKIVEKTATGVDGFDYFWDGTNWERDRGLQISDDLLYDVDYSNQMTTYEMHIKLQSDEIQYDGLQIPNPSGHILAFTMQLITGDNETIVFPSGPTSPEGFIDLRLAGAEDQDLPEYQPPTVVDDTETDYDYTYDEAAMLDAPSFIITLFILYPMGKLYRRKRKND